MKILVVAATEAEISGLITEVGNKAQGNPLSADQPPQSDLLLLSGQVSVLITGVGMVATAFALGRHLATHKYDLLLNLGIAGSFDRSIALGEVVEITTDTISELGAENDEQFIPVTELGFGESQFEATAVLKSYTGQTLRQVSAITVNTVHGNEQSIAKLASRLRAELESMEGAAFFYACQQFNVPGIQIRAVSNYVEKRNRDSWKIGLAVKNLNTFALELLNVLGVVSEN